MSLLCLQMSFWTDEAAVRGWHTTSNLRMRRALVKPHSSGLVASCFVVP